MKEAEINNKQRKLVKRKLPPGTSEYQVCKVIEE
jgi:pre-rRNA-processing protein TSR1